MTTDREKLLARVQKLMSLGASSNANEAAAALAKAEEMMREAGVTTTELKRSEIGETVLKSTQSVSKPKDWELALVCSVGRAFACRVLWQPGVSYRTDYWGRYKFVGPKDYAVLAEFAASTMLRQLVKAKANRNRELNAAGRLGRAEMSRQLNGFCWGWVTTVSKKVETFARETSTDLKRVVDEYCAEQTEGRVADNRRSKADMAALLEGVAAASDVEIHRPMTRADEMRKIAN